ncbi:folate family ECF transporter S component [Erysipelotrichaceae bacterium OttesenSCG-928-M19]|nr:folate family ECF transporter S component [Erysipelotrichaceae bacterium OttesenSCG-928-M19]
MDLIIVSQIIVFVVMIILFMITLKFDKTPISVKEMAIVAILCVLTAVLSKVLVIKIPPTVPIFVIGFSASISITLGILFSPKLALIAGVVIDIIGLLLAMIVGESSQPFLGFTLTAMLSCYLPSLLIRVTKKQGTIVLRGLIITALIAAISLAYFYLFNVSSISIDQQQNDLTDSLRYTILASLVFISILIIVINEITHKRFSTQSNMYVTPMQLTFIILIVEIVCHIILTSLWVNIMYGVPFVIGAATRIIKALLILPVNVAIIYLVLRYIPNEYKRHLIKEDTEELLLEQQDQQEKSY